MEMGDRIASKGSLSLPATPTSLSGLVRRGPFLELISIPVVPLRQFRPFIYHHGTLPKASKNHTRNDDTDGYSLGSAEAEASP